jgi:hypothetical protein
VADNEASVSKAAQSAKAGDGLQQSPSIKEQFKSQSESILRSSVSSSGKPTFDSSMAQDRLTILQNTLNDPSLIQSLEALKQQLPHIGADQLSKKAQVAALVEQAFSSQPNEKYQDQVSVSISGIASVYVGKTQKAKQPQAVKKTQKQTKTSNQLQKSKPKSSFWLWLKNTFGT